MRLFVRPRSQRFLFPLQFAVMHNNFIMYGYREWDRCRCAAVLSIVAEIAKSYDNLRAAVAAAANRPKTNVPSSGALRLQSSSNPRVELYRRERRRSRGAPTKAAPEKELDRATCGAMRLDRELQNEPNLIGWGLCRIRAHSGPVHGGAHHMVGLARSVPAPCRMQAIEAQANQKKDVFMDGPAILASSATTIG
jgi:hypothetical protein